MSTHRYIDRVCCVILVLTLMLTVVFVSASGAGSESAPRAMGYEDRLFDTSTVHTLDLVMDDWDSFISTCKNEEYSPCSVVIDGESFGNVGLRAKGNTSLTQVESYGNNRYSFKLEFDHYESGQTYHGLDKLSLNNIIQDNTYMKDYITYRMMGEFGAVSPLCSYVYIRVNGEDWGLYLAVEGVEEAFMQRNYGGDYGELYKPDSQSSGGAGNVEDGKGFMEKPGMDGTELPEGDRMLDMPEGGMEAGGAPGMGNFGGGEPRGDFGGFNGFGSSDVSLIYTDDEYSSYENIFNNAKTDITDEDRDRLVAALKRLNSCEDIDSTVDVESVIRYFVVHNFVCNFDSYTGSMIHNYYLYEDAVQLSMIPWDYNLAFGGFMGQEDATALINYPIDTPVSSGIVDSRPMLAWIFSSEEYTQLYHQYFAEFISGYFDSGAFSAELERVQALISPYVEKDPTSFCSYEEFLEGVSVLKDFCLLRAESVSGQLDGSIPAASAGQAENADVLIDGSDVDISAMGSMNNGGFGGMGRDRQQNQQDPMDKAETGDNAASSQQPPSEGGAAPAGGPLETVRTRESNSTNTQNKEGLITVLVCAAVLVTAIAGMLLYKKKA